jgi:glycerol kinase
MNEATALGSAIAAGLALGVFKDIQQVQNIPISTRTFSPTTSTTQQTEAMSRWDKAVNQSLGWI